MSEYRLLPWVAPLAYNYYTSVGCTCPSIWNGTVPPTCPLHNPSPLVVTTTTTQASTDYKCAVCKKRYRRFGDSNTSCCVIHQPNECCHAFEQRITKKGYPK